MGFGKSLKKAVKKISKVADPAGLTGKGDDEKPKQEAAASVTTPPAAVQVEAPKEDSTTADESDTEATKKSAASRGKRGLQVARSPGTGVNI